MPRAAVTWVENGQIRVSPLSDSASNLIGRAAGSTIHLPDEDTVSRQHALLRSEQARYVLEHLSRVNPTLVNNGPVSGNRALADGDMIEVGMVKLAFHDLAQAARPGVLSCHHCGRQNPPGQYDCWHCGSSLVNAPTLTGGESVLCRIVDQAGNRHDMTSRMQVAFDQAGNAEPVKVTAGDPARAHIAAQGPDIVIAPGSAAVTVNGNPVQRPQKLHTGDQVQVAGVAYTCILRR